MAAIRIKKETLVHAFGWTAAGTAAGYGLSFLRSIILARLLFPDDYGLFGLAAGVLMGLNVFTEFSLASKVVVTAYSSEEEERIHLNTIWTAGLIRGAAVTILMLFSAGPAAAWFHDARLASVLMIVSADPLIGAFQNIGLIRLQKELAFKTLTIQRRVGDAITFVITIGLAALTHNYLALVGSQLVGSLTGVLLSYTLCSYRPRIAFDGAALRDSIHFGKYLFVVSCLTFVTTQFDNFAVGHYIGAGSVGAYILAYRLAMLPVDALISVLNSVLFPAYSKVRLAEPHRFATFFPKLNMLSAGLVIAAVGPLALAARPVIRGLYGDRWLAAVEPLMILTFAGLFRGLAHTISPWLLSIRRPDLDAKCKMVEAVVFVTLTLTLVPRFGVVGAAWSGVASYALAYVMRLTLAVRLSRHEGISPGLVGFVRPVWIGIAAFGGAGLLGLVGAPVAVRLAAYYCLLFGLIYAANGFVRVEVRKTAAAACRWLV